MKFRNRFKWVLFALTTATSAHASAATITLAVNGIVGSKGKVLVALCDKDTFLKKCAQAKAAQATPGTLTFNFADVAPGKYAIAIFHDENDNGKLDSNFIGIPIEAHAFSRDARGKYGPPSFEDAAFDVGESKNEIAIQLKY